MTNLNADGAGSLKACIDATGARTCVFEVSGAIRITSDLTIRNGQLRIAGQTAPSPGIVVRGAAIKITASDVLIQHIRVRTGDDTNGPNPDNRDSLRHHALQQERRRLADTGSESSDIDSAVESGLDRLQRLQQSRELAEFHGSVHEWRGAGGESYIATRLVSAMMTRAG